MSEQTHGNKSSLVVLLALINSEQCRVECEVCRLLEGESAQPYIALIFDWIEGDAHESDCTHKKPMTQKRLQVGRRVSFVRLNGFWGRITISLRSEARHSQGELQARGIYAPTPKTPASESRSLFFVPVPVPVPVRAEPVEAFCSNQSPSSLMSSGAALTPQQATHFLLLRQERARQEKQVRRKVPT